MLQKLRDYIDWEGGENGESIGFTEETWERARKFTMSYPKPYMIDPDFEGGIDIIWRDGYYNDLIASVPVDKDKPITLYGNHWSAPNKREIVNHIIMTNLFTSGSIEDEAIPNKKMLRWLESN